ncbi:MAG: HAMP domain-containing protein [Lachnospiraceae bacterium]|nr:HAMP domain-containing protein [Lachnospiraceae bacterium]
MKKISKKARKQEPESIKKKKGIQELKRFYHETIKGKITVSVLALVIVSLSLLGIISSVLNSHSTNSTLERNMNATACVTAERVEWEITSYKNIAADLGMTARLANDKAETAEKKAIIDERVKVNGLLAGDILDSSGASIFSGEIFADTAYFQAAMQGQTYVTEPIISEDQSSIEIRIAAPLWKDGNYGTEVVGVVYLIPEENFLNDIMMAINVSENGSAYMMDGVGNVIAHENDALVKSKDNSIEAAKKDSALKALAKLEQKMLNGESGFGTYRYGGVKKIMAYTPVENSNNWSIAITAPVSDFNKETVAGVIITILIVIVSIAVAVFMVRKLADNIGTPIQQCAQRLTDLAKGDLHTEVPQVSSRDETLVLANATQNIVTDMQTIIGDVDYILGEMSNNNFSVYSRARESYVGDFKGILEAVRGIKRSLSETLNHIKDSADQVGLGSSQLAESAQSLAEGATDQAASVEELLATANDVANQVQRNTENAVSTSQKAMDIGKQADSSSAYISEMTRAMEKISDASMQIANIIQTIEEIADQTNLLSLNASIEAARAGEAGRGFAVVAGEIGHLATQCTDSVETTRKLIEAALHEVESGNRIADEMAQALQKVIDGMDGIVKAVEAVAENSNEQNASMQQINETIEVISEVVQTNSAAAEQSSATSQELSAQAAELNDMIGKFQLEEMQ